MVQPTGIGGPEQRATLVWLRAFGEIMNVPPPQLDPIIEKARKDLENKPDTPPPPPPPPTP